MNENVVAAIVLCELATLAQDDCDAFRFCRWRHAKHACDGEDPIRPVVELDA